MFFSKGGENIILYQVRLCVLNIDGLRERILIEPHIYRYPINPGSTKIYLDMRNLIMEWCVKRHGWLYS